MRVSDTAIGVAAILFGSWVIGYARNFPKLEKGYPGPSLFPTVLAVLFIVAGIVLIFQDLRSKKRYSNSTSVIFPANTLPILG